MLKFQSLAICYNALYEQYSNFVGAPHITTIVRLCGYQDIAVILTELLEVVNSIVSTDFIYKGPVSQKPHCDNKDQ